MSREAFETPLSEMLKQWRAERPDEWTMDEFIRAAQQLEAATSAQEARVRELEEALREIARFGHNEGHGRGFTCADMAEQALSATAREE